jgi:hypothetical protein
LHPQLAPARLPAVKYAVIDLGEGLGQMARHPLRRCYGRSDSRPSRSDS